MWPIGGRGSHEAGIVELPPLGWVTETRDASKRPRVRNVPTFAETEDSLRLDRYDCSRLVSLTGAERLGGVHPPTPTERAAPKFSTRGGYFGAPRVGVTKGLSP